MTLFEELGGEARLRPLITEFVHTMTADAMIGFFFNGIDAERLAELEYQFTARFLGADVAYEGRPLKKAHAHRPIFGGQFDRRRQILLETIDRHQVPAAIKSAWLAHVDSLRATVTRDAPGQCEDPEEKPSPFSILS